MELSRMPARVDPKVGRNPEEGSFDIDDASLASSSALGHLASRPPVGSTSSTSSASSSCSSFGPRRFCLAVIALDLVLVHTALIWLVANNLGVLPVVWASSEAHLRSEENKVEVPSSAPAPDTLAAPIVRRVVIKNGTYSCDLSVADYGAVGDGVVDDTASVQATLDAAFASGLGSVCLPAGLYATSSTLVIRAGVTLRGMGLGTDPRQPDLTSGSTIGYCGDGYAIELRNAHLAGLDGLMVATTFNCADPAAALGGVILHGTGGSGGVESAVLRSVFIFRFLGGVGLTLLANDGAGIAYCSFYDVRVRHAKEGIRLEATGIGGSFVNSNTFYHGAVSGGGFEYGVRLKGPGPVNNAVFIGMVVEPYETTFGHFYVSGANSALECTGCRAEGAGLDETAPLLVFEDGTSGSSWIGGLTDGGLILADPLNHDLSGIAGVGLLSSSRNLFPNSRFAGAGTKPGASATDATPPFWTTTGAASVAVSSSTAAWATGASAFSNPPPLATTSTTALTINVNPGATATLKPDASYAPLQAWPPRRASALVCSLGAWMRTCAASGSSIRAVATSVGPSGLASGSPLPRDGEWHWVGLTGPLPDTAAGSAPITAAFYFMHEDGGGSDECVEVAMPSFSFGKASLGGRDDAAIGDGGGVIAGTLSTGIAAAPVQASTFWTLPPHGNVFRVQASTIGGGFTTLARLNSLAADRMSPGTQLVLLFEVAGVTVVDSAYVDLTGGGFSSTAGDALCLVSLGSGTWRELWRNRAV